MIPEEKAAEKPAEKTDGKTVESRPAADPTKQESSRAEAPRPAGEGSRPEARPAAFQSGCLPCGTQVAVNQADDQTSAGRFFRI